MKLCLNKDNFRQYGPDHPLDQFDELVLQRIDFNELIEFHPNFFIPCGEKICELHFEFCDLSHQQLYDCLILMSNLVSLTIKVKNELFTGDLLLTNESESIINANLRRVKSFTVAIDTRKYDLAQVRNLMQKMSNLETLIFASCPLHVGVANIFSQYIQMFREVNLNHLSLENLVGSAFLLAFSEIAQDFNVKKLSLGALSYEHFEEHHDSFEYFCYKLSDVRILTISTGEKQLSHICKYMAQLTELNFTTIIPNQNIQVIKDLRKLQKLTLKCIREFNDEQLLELFPQLLPLNELRLDVAVTIDILNQICVAQTNLTVLKLFKLKTTDLSAVFRNLQNLRRLHLDFLEVEHDDFIVYYDITNLNLLEKLKINSYAPGMTIELIETLPNLQPESLSLIRARKL